MTAREAAPFVAMWPSRAIAWLTSDRTRPQRARETIDAHGKRCAGFINMLAHPEESLLATGVR